ncbi:MAG: 50S ribosomal protein L29 [Gammaproteobacteria bacterium]|nr:50S ribosomal protein L29 [Gammaproteobacteria bacterium]
MTKAVELRQKKSAELLQLLTDLRREQFNLRMQRGTGQLARPSQVRLVRRDIARIQTILNEQKRNGAGK